MQNRKESQGSTNLLKQPFPNGNYHRYCPINLTISAYLSGFPFEYPTIIIYYLMFVIK